MKMIQRALIALMFSILSARSLAAQITVSQQPLRDGSAGINIRNDARVALAAYVISGQWRQGERVFKHYADSLVDGTRPLLPNEERVEIGEDPPSWKGPVLRLDARRPVTSAGIFVDGSTTGDPALISDLMTRRSSLLLAVETTLETLLNAGRHNVPRTLMIQEFTAFANLARRAYLTPEEQAGWRIYDATLSNLINLPEMPQGAAFPPTSFVDQEVAALVRRRAALEQSRPSLENRGQTK